MQWKICSKHKKFVTESSSIHTPFPQLNNERQEHTDKKWCGD